MDDMQKMRRRLRSRDSSEEVKTTVRLIKCTNEEEDDLIVSWSRKVFTPEAGWGGLWGQMRRVTTPRSRAKVGQLTLSLKVNDLLKPAAWLISNSRSQFTNSQERMRMTTKRRRKMMVRMRRMERMRKRRTTRGVMTSDRGRLWFVTRPPRMVRLLLFV